MLSAGLGTAVGAGALASLLAACSGDDDGTTTSTGVPVSSTDTTVRGSDFAEPQTLRSADGRLEVTLRAEATQLPYGNGTRYALTYNGTAPGPTLRVRPGDRLVITLENALDQETNLHTHGLHVSPSGNSDNVFPIVAPGASRTYTYDIPTNHRSGTFWYHPHAHGFVASQVSGGLAGAIVVEDAVDALPEIQASVERVWVLADPVLTDSAGALNASHMTQMWGREGDLVLVNGMEHPVVTTMAGGVERWRFVNASASRYYRLAVDGHALDVLGTDGGRLVAPVAVEDLLLAPGERLEFAVRPTAAGTYTVRSLGYDRGRPGMGGGGNAGGAMSGPVELASMVVVGSEAPGALPTALLPESSAIIGAPSASRTVELAMGMANGGMGGGGMGGGMGGGGMGFTIDGKTFDPARTDISLSLGHVEDWTIRNTSNMDHPFHLHVWPLRVQGAAASVGWKDTVNVPAGSSVTIRIDFSDFAGRTVYHCHILDHEDIGMMGIINVSESV